MVCFLLSSLIQLGHWSNEFDPTVFLTDWVCFIEIAGLPTQSGAESFYSLISACY